MLAYSISPARPRALAFWYASSGESASIRCVLTWTTFRGSPSIGVFEDETGQVPASRLRDESHDDDSAST